MTASKKKKRVLKGAHTEADHTVARLVVAAMRRVVPDTYDCCIVLRNTKTLALRTLANLPPGQEHSLLEAAVDAETLVSRVVPETH
jgi:hypothetical protein